MTDNATPLLDQEPEHIEDVLDSIGEARAELYRFENRYAREATS